MVSVGNVCVGNREWGVDAGGSVIDRRKQACQSVERCFAAREALYRGDATEVLVLDSGNPDVGTRDVRSPLAGVAGEIDPKIDADARDYTALLPAVQTMRCRVA